MASGGYGLEDRKPLKLKWDFKMKRNEDDSIKYKERLVAKGYAQSYGVDYVETYSPVVKYNTIRYLLAMAVREDLKIIHMDVTTAYLNGKLDEDIFVEPLEGMEHIYKKCTILKLKSHYIALNKAGEHGTKHSIPHYKP